MLKVRGASISADGHEHVALTAVVTVATEVDVTTVSQLRAALLTACSTCPTVVVDMSQTAFCDSSGLTALIQARQRTRADGGELRLVITTPQVLSTFTVTGADRMFPVFASLRDALAAGPAPRPPARDLGSSAAIQKGTPRWEILQDALEAAAFDLIRRASQLANIKVRILAAEIVEHVAPATAKPSAQPTHPPASNHR